MDTRLLLCVLAAFSLGGRAEDCNTISVISGPSVDSTNFLSLHGKPKLNGIHLVDQHDDSLHLIGVSSHNILTFSDCYTFSALQHLVTEWGITVFRITVYLEEANGYYDKPSENDAAIAQLVDWCETLGIYAVIDYHVHEIGDPNHYLDSMGASTGPAITFWQTQAHAYKNKDHVIYEIANEPNNVDWQPNLAAYLNAVIAAIRAIDAETIIIAGVPHWSQGLYYPGNDGGITNTYNVMYAFHFYAAAHDFLYEVVETYSRILPIFVSEWSPSHFDSVTAPNLDVSDLFTSLFSGTLPNNPQKISSTVWNFGDKAGEEVSLLTNGACATESWTSLTCSGKYLKNYIYQYRNDTTFAPTWTPTYSPTHSPTQPTETNSPTLTPTVLPTMVPTVDPSSSPTTPEPTIWSDSCIADPSLMVKVRKKN